MFYGNINNIGDQMRRNRGERHCAHLRITGHLAAGVTLCAEVLAVGRAVGRAQRGAVHRPQAQSLERMVSCVLRRPGTCCLLKRKREFIST